MRPVKGVLAARDVFELCEARVDGCRIVARRSTVAPRTPDPPLVLLGGTVLSGRYLLPVAVELARRFPVWVPDLPGRGASEVPRPDLTIEEHADLLVRWMGEVGVGRAALVGNSMGCQIAVEAAVRHPDAVSHLVLQGPTPDPCARSAPRQVARLLLDGFREPWSLGPIELVDWLRAGVRYPFHQSRFAIEHRVEQRLPDVRQPTLVVRGAKDPVVPQVWAQQVTQLIPDARLRVIPGAAHAIVYSHGSELARLTEEFLRPAGPDQHTSDGRIPP